MKSILIENSFDSFENEEALAEISRVLVPTGRVGFLRRIRDVKVPWVKELEDIVASFSEDFNRTEGYSDNWKASFDDSPFFQDLKIVSSLDAPEVYFTTRFSLHDVLNYVHRLRPVRLIGDQTKLEEMDEQIRCMFEDYLHRYLKFENALQVEAYGGEMYARHNKVALLHQMRRIKTFRKYVVLDKLPMRFVNEIYWTETKPRPKIIN